MSIARDEQQAVALPADLADSLAQVAPRAAPFARRVVYFDVVGSTNDVAHRLAAEGAAEGTLVIAHSQTAGRGRMARSWFSPPGAGLYFSCVLRPVTCWPPGSPPAARPLAPALTLAAGVAMAEALRTTTGVEVMLKWPNDLMVGQRKLGGILAEGHGAGARIDHVILGVGVNLRRVDCPPDVAARATSIEAESGRAASPGPLLAESLQSLAAVYADYRQGRIDHLLARWRALAADHVGRRVAWDEPNGSCEGTTEGIDEEGALIVRTGDRVVRLVAGEVRWL